MTSTAAAGPRELCACGRFWIYAHEYPTHVDQDGLVHRPGVCEVPR